MTISINGVVNVNKPPGITSFKTVSLVRKLFGVKKAGHTGTLDPTASGVLPICLGKATRIGQFLLSSNKVYLGTMKLGIRTDTQDSEGKVTETHEDFSVDEAQILEIFSHYTGEIEQIPPMYSAKKIDGKKLYELARKGIELERKPKTVKIKSLSFLRSEGDEITFRAETSPGTYIRTLCDDIGQDLGCGAHLKTLVREKVGNLDISEAVTLEALRELKKLGRLNEVLNNIDKALSFYPLAQVDQKAKKDIIRGKQIGKNGIKNIQRPFKAMDIFRVAGPDGSLIALMEMLVGNDGYESIDTNEPILKSRKVLGH